MTLASYQRKFSRVLPRCELRAVASAHGKALDYDERVANENPLEGLGTVSIRPIENDFPRPVSTSIYDEWGEMAPEIRDLVITRWLITLTQSDKSEISVGDLSAHAVWYGPTPGSRSLNIGEQKALERAGFKYEGTLRKAQARIDALHDIQVWSHIYSHTIDVE